MSVVSRCSSSCQNSDLRFILEKILAFSILPLMPFCLVIGMFVTLHASSVNIVLPSDLMVVQFAEVVWFRIFFCEIVVIKLALVARILI